MEDDKTNTCGPFPGGFSFDHGGMPYLVVSVHAGGFCRFFGSKIAERRLAEREQRVRHPVHRAVGEHEALCGRLPHAAGLQGARLCRLRGALMPGGGGGEVGCGWVGWGGVGLGGVWGVGCGVGWVWAGGWGGVGEPLVGLDADLSLAEAAAGC